MYEHNTSRTSDTTRIENRTMALAVLVRMADDQAVASMML